MQALDRLRWVRCSRTMDYQWGFHMANEMHRRKSARVPTYAEAVESFNNAPWRRYTWPVTGTIDGVSFASLSHSITHNIPPVDGYQIHRYRVFCRIGGSMYGGRAPEEDTPGNRRTLDFFEATFCHYLKSGAGAHEGLVDVYENPDYPQARTAESIFLDREVDSTPGEHDALNFWVGDGPNRLSGDVRSGERNGWGVLIASNSSSANGWWGRKHKNFWKVDGPKGLKYCGYNE